MKVNPFRPLYGLDPVSTIDTIFLNTPLSDSLSLADATCRPQECRQIFRGRAVESQAAAKLGSDQKHRHVEHQDG